MVLFDFFQGRCIAKGSYREVVGTNVNIEEKELAQEIGDEVLPWKRRFSRQMSCSSDEGSFLSPVTSRRRLNTFNRQVSSSSRCTFTESTAAVAADITETVVYVSA